MERGMWKAVFRKEDARIEELFEARDSKEALGKAQLLAERKGWKLLRVEEIGEVKEKPKGISEEEVEAMIEKAIIEEEEEEDIIDEFEWEEDEEYYQGEPEFTARLLVSSAGQASEKGRA